MSIAAANCTPPYTVRVPDRRANEDPALFDAPRITRLSGSIPLQFSPFQVRRGQLKRAGLKLLKLLFLFVGLALLGWVLQETDLGELWRRVVQIGWSGMSIVIALYALNFLTDVVGWQLAFQSVPLDLRWAWRLYLVKTVGEAFNNVTPTASVGGEPLKALLLKTHYEVGYRESSATIVIAKTTILLGLMLFLLVGFLLLLASDRVPSSYRTVAGAGLIALTFITTNFFLWQRLRLTSVAGSRFAFGRFGERIDRWLEVINDIDDQFLHFYADHRTHFAGALLLAILNWVLGVVEVYLVMGFLGFPISFAEAWIIESMAQLVRAGAFFIPAAIGAQEGAFLLVCGAITGSPTLGMALALVRRARELLWIFGGLCLWWMYSLRTPALVSEPDSDLAG